MKSKRKLLRAYPHLEELDNYSLKVAAFIDLEYPQWMGYAGIGEFEGEKYLEVRVPAPYEPQERDLLIYTHHDRITVAFYWYHAHFYSFPHGLHNLKYAFSHTKKFIEQIIDEQLVFGVYFETAAYKISKCWSVDNLDKISSDMKVSHLRSWRGTYNRRFE